MGHLSVNITLQYSFQADIIKNEAYFYINLAEVFMVSYDASVGYTAISAAIWEGSGSIVLKFLCLCRSYVEIIGYSIFYLCTPDIELLS